jgi:hypothetical protein
VACWSSDSEGGDAGVRGSDEAGDGAGRWHRHVDRWINGDDGGDTQELSLGLRDVGGFVVGN